VVISTPSVLMKNIFLGLLVVCATSCAAYSGDLSQSKPAKRTLLASEEVSFESNQMRAWITETGNNNGLPFIILDKKFAKVYVFQGDGQLRGASPALIGSAVGDHSVPGIGERKLSAILPHERTTPAGRFVGYLDRNLQNREILWVDYDAALSIHAVITNNIEEHRAARLETPTPLDNRISYGCINVPGEFFKDVIHPTFSGSSGVVYILPETLPVLKFFGAYNVDNSHQ
jgi:hypothetical protein